MNLTYDAIAADGARVRDSLQANSVKEAIESLRRRGLLVTSIEPAPEAKVDRRATTQRINPNTVHLRIKQLMMFTRQMAMLLKSGSSVVPAIIAVSKQMKRPEHRRMLEMMRDELEEGKPLAECLQRFPRSFDASYCAVIAAAESSATMPEMFEQLATMVNKRRSMQNRVIGALVYPALLCGLSVNIMGVMFFFVIPRFAEMFQSLDVPLPQSTKIMMAMANGLRSGWYLVAIAIGGLIATAVFLIRSDMGRQWLSNIQTRVFVVGILMSRLIQARLFRIVGTLLQAHVGLLDALTLARGVTRNDQFHRLLDRIEEAVAKGDSISSAMDRGNLINASIVQAIRTGEQSGRMGEAITYAADVMDEENSELLGTLTRLVEPVILILMGVVVGTVAISLFMPLLDMTAAV